MGLPLSFTFKILAFSALRIVENFRHFPYPFPFFCPFSFLSCTVFSFLSYSNRTWNLKKRSAPVKKALQYSNNLNLKETQLLSAIAALIPNTEQAATYISWNTKRKLSCWTSLIDNCLAGHVQECRYGFYDLVKSKRPRGQTEWQGRGSSRGQAIWWLPCLTTHTKGGTAL
jgi:hypothetical protein